MNKQEQKAKVSPSQGSARNTSHKKHSVKNVSHPWRVFHGPIPKNDPAIPPRNMRGCRKTNRAY